MNYDLNIVISKECTGNCNKNDRSLLTLNDICTKVKSEIDGLPIRCVGSWSQQKIYYLLQYFGIFSAAMHDKWSGNINYVEIGCGIGRCVARDLKIEFDGTSLGIIKHKEFEHISKAIFIDFDQYTIEILNKRIDNQSVNKCYTIVGDYNNPVSLIGSLKELIDIRRGLTLFFIDPTDCSVPFDLIYKIKNAFPNSDFIINLAIGTDFTRNVVGSVKKSESYVKVRNKYISFLGSKDFFTDPQTLEFVKINDTKNLRTKFREYYLKSLASIGLSYADFKRVRPYYDLVFASQHKKGIEFWKKATKNEYDGQRTINFNN